MTTNNPVEFYEPEDPDEKAAFYDLENNSDRAAAIVGGTLVERRLEALIEKRMIAGAQQTKNEMFRSTGPLGPFGTKIDLAYLLDLIDKDIHRDLDYLKRIRNSFAHRLDVQSFTNQQIAAWLDNMGATATWRRISTSKDSPSWLRELMAKKLATPRGQFMMAVRYLLWNLIHIERRTERPSPETPSPPPPQAPQKPGPTY